MTKKKIDKLFDISNNPKGPKMVFYIDNYILYNQTTKSDDCLIMEIAISIYKQSTQQN